LIMSTKPQKPKNPKPEPSVEPAPEISTAEIEQQIAQDVLSASTGRVTDKITAEDRKAILDASFRAFKAFRDNFSAWLVNRYGFTIADFPDVLAFIGELAGVPCPQAARAKKLKAKVLQLQGAN